MALKDHLEWRRVLKRHSLFGQLSRTGGADVVLKSNRKGMPAL